VCQVIVEYNVFIDEVIWWRRAKMRILVVTPHYFPEAFSISAVCEELAKRGHSVFVLTGQPCYGKTAIYPGYEKSGEDQRNGVNIYRVKVAPRKRGTLSLLANYYSFWKNSTKYVRTLRTEFDVVFSVCLSPITSVSAAVKYSRLHHVPHIHHCLDLWPASVVAVGKKSHILYSFCLRLSKKLYNQMDEILVSSPSFIDYFKNVLEIKNKNIIFVPQPSLLTKGIMETPHQYSSEVNLVYAGNIGSIQGVENLVLACLPFKDNPPFCLHIIGSGSNLSKVLHLIETNGLSEIVKYEGVIAPDEIGKWLSSASALLVSLRGDVGVVSSTIPNKLITYLGFGKPIIASISGDGALICKESGGCLVTSEDVDDISNNYRKFLSITEKEKNAMCLNNLTFFDSHFALRKVVDKIEKEIINSSLNKNGQ
jgi:Glycosyltransferase